MDNRTKVLNCATHLFFQKGYDAVGVQELVNCAAITKPTLYHYFGNKRGVLDAIFKEGFNPYLNQLSLATEYANDLPFSLQKILRVSFKFANQNKSFYQLYLSVLNAPSKSEAFQSATPYAEHQFNEVKTLFKNAANDHGNMRNRHEAYALTFLGMMHSYIRLSFEQKIDLNEAIIAQALQQFQYGIYS